MKTIISPLILMIIAVSALDGADIQRLVNDTQRLKQKADAISLVWWIPVEFWDATLAEDPHLTEEQKTNFVAALEDYTAFAVIYGNTGPLGGTLFKDRSEIEKNISFVVDEVPIEPLPLEELSPDARMFYSMMKPMMEQMLGQFGEGLEFFVYPNRKDKKQIVDPMKEGSFSYMCFGDRFEWRLPLGALMPPSVDPETGDVFPGNYKFDPFTGAKLLQE